MKINNEGWTIALRRLLLVGVLFALATSFLGCTSSGYRTYTLREGIAHFSLEYPDSYVETLVSTQFGYTDVTFSHPGQDEDCADSLFWVTVNEVGIYESARAALERGIAFCSDYFADYQLLERSAVTIDGIEGEFLVCSYTPTEIPTDDGCWGGPELLLLRQIYFDYNGLIWEVANLSYEERVEADETVWEHLLETFQILD